jgi:predicted dehydrogenase
MHVLVEKPFTVRSPEAKLLVEESQRSGSVLMVDHTYVFSPAFQAIQELIATRKLGALRYYHANRLNCFGPAHDTNVLWDLAVHDLAMLDLLMPSPPASIQAVGLSWPNCQAESHAQLLLAYPDRGIASVLVSWVAPRKVRTVLLGFDQHTIIWDDLAGSCALQLFDRGVEPLSSAKLQLRKEAEVIQVAPHEPLSQVIYHFLECVLGRNQPRTDGSAGLRTVRIMEIAGQAMARSGLPIVVKPGDIAA